MKPKDDRTNVHKRFRTSFGRTSEPEIRDGSTIKLPYVAPKLQIIPNNELPLAIQNTFYSVKYLYINDVFAKYREAFIEESLRGATIHKYRLLFDTLPRTFERQDVVIVGGNDPDRLASFIKVNRPLVHRVPTIAVAATLSPKARADLLKLGYDDVTNLKGITTQELAARVSSIFNRHKITEEKFAILQNYSSVLGEICEINKLSSTQRLVIEALLQSKNKFCRYGQLRSLISRNLNSPSLMHLRVIVHGIRASMKPGYRIENVRGIGYRLIIKNHYPEKNINNGD